MRYGGSLPKISSFRDISKLAEVAKIPYKESQWFSFVDTQALKESKYNYLA